MYSNQTKTWNLFNIPRSLFTHSTRKRVLSPEPIPVQCCAQSGPTLGDPMGWSPPGSSVHGISQARILDWFVISSSSRSSPPRDWIHISCTGRWILYHWATREAPKPNPVCTLISDFQPLDLGENSFMLLKPPSLGIWLLSSVQLSRSVVSNSLQPHESQHARPPCPSQTPRVYSNSCPSSWCHPAISSSVIPFSSCSQCFPASGSFPMSQLFAWGGQSIAVPASASVLPMNTQDWSLGWTGWISFQSKGLPGVFSNTTVQKHQFFGTQLSSQSNSHIHTWPLEKP